MFALFSGGAGALAQEAGAGRQRDRLVQEQEELHGELQHFHQKLQRLAERLSAEGAADAGKNEYHVRLLKRCEEKLIELNTLQDMKSVASQVHEAKGADALRRAQEVALELRTLLDILQGNLAEELSDLQKQREKLKDQRERMERMEHEERQLSQELGRMDEQTESAETRRLKEDLQQLLEAQRDLGQKTQERLDQAELFRPLRRQLDEARRIQQEARDQTERLNPKPDPEALDTLNAMRGELQAAIERERQAQRRTEQSLSAAALERRLEALTQRQRDQWRRTALASATPEEELRRAVEHMAQQQTQVREDTSAYQQQNNLDKGPLMQLAERQQALQAAMQELRDLAKTPAGLDPQKTAAQWLSEQQQRLTATPDLSDDERRQREREFQELARQREEALRRAFAQGQATKAPPELHQALAQAQEDMAQAAKALKAGNTDAGLELQHSAQEQLAAALDAWRAARREDEAFRAQSQEPLAEQQKELALQGEALAEDWRRAAREAHQGENANARQAERLDPTADMVADAQQAQQRADHALARQESLPASERHQAEALEHFDEARRAMNPQSLGAQEAARELGEHAQGAEAQAETLGEIRRGLEQWRSDRAADSPEARDADERLQRAQEALSQAARQLEKSEQSAAAAPAKAPLPENAEREARQAQEQRRQALTDMEEAARGLERLGDQMKPGRFPETAMRQRDAKAAIGDLDDAIARMERLAATEAQDAQAHAEMMEQQAAERARAAQAQSQEADRLAQDAANTEQNAATDEQRTQAEAQRRLAQSRQDQARQMTRQAQDLQQAANAQRQAGQQAQQAREALQGMRETSRQAQQAARQAQDQLEREDRPGAIDRQDQALEKLDELGKALGQEDQRLQERALGQVKNLQDDQQRIAEQAETLAERAAQAPENGNPQRQQAQRNLEEASRQLQQAAQQLGEQSPQPAQQSQRQGQEKIEEALKNLEQQARKDLTEDQERQLEDMQSRQRRLQEELDQLSEQIENPQARQNAKNAQQDMQQAQNRMNDRQMDQAEQNAEQAADEMQKAKERLQEEEDRYAQMEAERRLLQVENALRELRQGQLELLGKTRELNDTLSSMSGAQTRATKREARDLANQQRALQTDTEKAAKLLEEDEAAIFAWILRKTTEDQQEVQTLLRGSEAGPYTQELERDIITKIERLQNALKQERERRGEQARQGGQQGGGQQGGPQRQQAVPTLAELEMLRLQQELTGERAKRLQTQSAHNRREMNDLQRTLWERLSHDQGELRDKAAELGSKFGIGE